METVPKPAGGVQGRLIHDFERQAKRYQAYYEVLNARADFQHDLRALYASASPILGLGQHAPESDQTAMLEQALAFCDQWWLPCGAGEEESFYFGMLDLLSSIGAAHTAAQVRLHACPRTF